MAREARSPLNTSYKMRGFIIVCIWKPHSKHSADLNKRWFRICWIRFSQILSASPQTCDLVWGGAFVQGYSKMGTLPHSARRPFHMATSQQGQWKGGFDQNYRTMVTHITGSPWQPAHAFSKSDTVGVCVCLLTETIHYFSAGLRG